MRIDEIEEQISRATVNHLAARVRTFLLNPLDRAELLHEIRDSKHFVPVSTSDTAPLAMCGVEIRKSPWVPEGIAAVLDGEDKLVCVIRLGH